MPPAMTTVQATAKAKGSTARASELKSPAPTRLDKPRGDEQDEQDDEPRSSPADETRIMAAPQGRLDFGQNDLGRAVARQAVGGAGERCLSAISTGRMSIPAAKMTIARSQTICFLELGGIEQDGLPATAGAACRFPAWCRRTMPRVGSKQSSVRASAAIQRAIVTFCWLPPDRRCTSRCARVSICSRSMALHGGILAPDGDRTPVPKGGGEGQRVFSRTDCCMASASVRSPGT